MVFHESFKGVSGKFQGSFKNVSRVVQGRLKGISKQFFRGFQEDLKEVKKLY